MQFLAEAILENLRDPEAEPVSSLPFCPKGGEHFLFKGKGVKTKEWWADVHQWINQGTAASPRKGYWTSRPLTNSAPDKLGPYKLGP